MKNLFALGPRARDTVHGSMSVRHIMRPTCSISSDDRKHMRHALDLAKRGLGKTHPNPAVGCVILNHGKVGCMHRPSDNTSDGHATLEVQTHGMV